MLSHKILRDPGAQLCSNTPGCICFLLDSHSNHWILCTYLLLHLCLRLFLYHGWKKVAQMYPRNKLLSSRVIGKSWDALLFLTLVQSALLALVNTLPMVFSLQMLGCLIHCYNFHSVSWVIKFRAHSVQDPSLDCSCTSRNWTRKKI